MGRFTLFGLSISLVKSTVLSNHRIYLLLRIVRVSVAWGLWKEKYLGFWDGTSEVPNFGWFSNSSTPIGEGESNSVIEETSPGEDTSYVWKGFYESRWSLPVKFRLTSDGNAALLVNEKIVINKLKESGESKLSTKKSKTLLLKRKKRTSIVLYYSNKVNPGSVKLEWKYDIAQGFEVDFSEVYFFHDPSVY